MHQEGDMVEGEEVVVEEELASLPCRTWVGEDYTPLEAVAYSLAFDNPVEGLAHSLAEVNTCLLVHKKNRVYNPLVGENLEVGIAHICVVVEVVVEARQNLKMFSKVRNNIYKGFSVSVCETFS